MLLLLLLLPPLLHSLTSKDAPPLPVRQEEMHKRHTCAAHHLQHCGLPEAGKVLAGVDRSTPRHLQGIKGGGQPHAFRP